MQMSAKRRADAPKETIGPRQARRRAAFLRKRLSPRVRDVFQDLMADRSAAGAWLECQVLKTAELAVRAEELRARLETMSAAPEDLDQVRSLATLINAVTRLEGTARRAAADLAKAAPAKPAVNWLVQQHLDAAERVKQQRLLAMQQGRPKHAQK
jgi:hypothetical protein